MPVSRHLFDPDDYRKLTAAWLAAGNHDVYLQQLALEYCEKAPALGIEPETYGFPEGCRQAFDVHYFLPGENGATSVLALVFADEVAFSCKVDGVLLDEEDFPYDKQELAFGLWGAMNEMLLDASRAEMDI